MASPADHFAVPEDATSNVTGPNNPLTRDCYHRVLFWVGLLIILIGICNFLGNLFDIPFLRKFTTRPAPEVATITAVSFLCLGLILVSFGRYLPKIKRSPFYQLLVNGLILFIFASGFYYTFRYFLVVRFDISKILYSDFSSISVPFENAMNRILIAACLWIFLYFPRRTALVTYGLGIACMFVLYFSFFSISSYILQLPTLYSFSQTIPSIIVFLLASGGLLYATIPDSGILSPLSSRMVISRVLGFSGIALSLAILMVGISFVYRLNQSIASLNPLKESHQSIIHFFNFHIQQILASFELATVLLAIAGAVMSLRAVYFYDQSRKNELQVQNQQEIRRAVMESMGEGLYTLDPNGKLVYMNPAAEKLLGWRLEEIIGKPMHDIVHFQHCNGRGFPESDCALLNVLRTGRPFTQEDSECFIRKDGECFFVSYASAPILRDGNVIGIVCTFRDKTREKEAEEELRKLAAELEQRVAERTRTLETVNMSLQKEISDRIEFQKALAESEMRFRAIFNQSFQYMGILSPDGTILAMNESVLATIHAKAEDVIGQPFWETQWWSYSKSLQEEMKSTIQRAAAGECPHYETEYFGFAPEDTENRKPLHLHADFSVKPIRNRQGEIIMLIPEGRDITERKCMEDALKESEERFRNMSDCAPMMVCLFDETLNVSYINKTWMEFTGLFGEVALEYGWRQVVHPEDLHEITVLGLESTARRESYPLSFRLRKTDGQYRWILGHCSPYLTPSGQYIGYIFAGMDNHEQHESQELLAKAKEAAETANRQKTQVLAFVSHDFKNPLNAIIGYSEILESGVGGDLTEKQKKFVHNISASSRHLFDMVTDILDIARAEAGKLTLAITWIELQPFIEDVQSIMLPMAEQKHVDLTFEVAPDVHGILADPKYLRLILINLISNAIKYNREGGKVSCRFSLNHLLNQVSCQVVDTGLGISADKLSLLFSEYYRIPDKTTTREEGTGLGLAFIKKLVELHGGMIHVESIPKVGSNFTIQLPQIKTVMKGIA